MTSSSVSGTAGRVTAESASSPMAGIAWMVLANLVFVTQDATTRVLTRSYPVIEVAWGRFTVHLIVAILLIGWHNPALFRSARPGLQLLRSGLLCALTLMSTVCLKYLPFVDFSAIMTVIPVIITALSVPILHERVGWRRWVAVMVGLAGALTIIGPGVGVGTLDLQWIYLLPFVAATTSACYQIATRLLKGADPAPTTFFFTGIVGTAVLSALLPFQWVTPTPLHGAMMVMLGVMGAFSHYCIIRAFLAAQASTVAPFNYTNLVWAMMFGMFVFQEMPSGTTLAGAAMITAAGLYIIARERRRAQG
ncbi:DMT family transporter [Azospirillum thermophilum]|uniref:EamA/RhaT family transporter n=1 Tax=Azospirillum thermophilum TaxID=2202148 RepID=A0A2S2CKH1_9PROT|nr:DMT family transporter [Azospirillum thermophilum]AWK84994.1 EamA/RhaT family transporter [Azospirillum thermophilum]